MKNIATHLSHPAPEGALMEHDVTIQIPLRFLRQITSLSVGLRQIYHPLCEDLVRKTLKYEFITGVVMCIYAPDGSSGDYMTGLMQAYDNNGINVCGLIYESPKYTVESQELSHILSYMLTNKLQIVLHNDSDVDLWGTD